MLRESYKSRDLRIEGHVDRKIHSSVEPGIGRSRGLWIEESVDRKIYRSKHLWIDRSIGFERSMVREFCESRDLRFERAVGREIRGSRDLWIERSAAPVIYGSRNRQLKSSAVPGFCDLELNSSLRTEMRKILTTSPGDQLRTPAFFPSRNPPALKPSRPFPATKPAASPAWRWCRLAVRGKARASGLADHPAAAQC